jgi:hypothetical protein
VTGSYTLLLVNFAGQTTLTLPAHSKRVEYVLTSDGLTSKKTVLGGDVLAAASDGKLPALHGRPVDGSVTSFAVPAEAVAFVVMEGLGSAISGC